MDPKKVRHGLSDLVEKMKKVMADTFKMLLKIEDEVKLIIQDKKEKAYGKVLFYEHFLVGSITEIGDMLTKIGNSIQLASEMERKKTHVVLSFTLDLLMVLKEKRENLQKVHPVYSI
ncbi:MAG: hypothetical protein AAB870_01915 [Patescibacteria group bacterium]